MRTARRGAWGIGLATILAVRAASGAAPTPQPDPAVPFGRVIYRASKVAGFESLGVTMIACRHRDPVPRRFAVEFFDRGGRLVKTGAEAPASPPMPAGKKIVFVTDGLHFAGEDVFNLRLGHLSIGTARVVSDAEIVHCVGKIRMDPGARSPSYRDAIGFVREGQPPPMLGTGWSAPPRPSPRR